MTTNIAIQEDRMDSAPATRLKPKISITAVDHSRLAILTEAAATTMPDVAGWLADELDRAFIIEDDTVSTNVVRMGYEVVFKDNTTDQVQTVSLVYPNEADISLKKISILTPIGVALIGMFAGQAISWETRTGEIRDLTVLEVRSV
jgi:regulator of nucleoside diphosphate kinase